MIIKVSEIAQVTNYLQDRKEQHQQTKFYKPQEPKREVKSDFGLLLDAEIEKLSINILI